MTGPLSVSEALPDYVIGEELGSGRFGTVWRAHHRQLDRAVAVRQLPPSLTGDPAVRQRFGAGAKVLASITHPHVVPIYDYVEQKGMCLLVMEHMGGGTVRSQADAGNVSANTACAVVMAACAGLHHAHERGVRHGDLKAESLLLAADGAVKVADLGLVGIVDGGVATVAADVGACGAVLLELLSERRSGEEAPGEVIAVAWRAIAGLDGDGYATAEALGAAVGEAAKNAWGAEWMSQAKMRPGDLGPGYGTSASTPVAAPAPASSPAVAEPEPEPEPEREPAADAEPPVAAEAEVVRDQARIAAEPALGQPELAEPSELAGSKSVPTEDLFEEWPRSRWAVGGSVLLLLVTLLIGFVGLGRPAPDVVLPAGAVMVAGTDVASGEVVVVDLGHPVEMTVGVLPAEAQAAAAVQLGFSVGGVPLPASGIGVPGQSDGRQAMTVEATSARFLAAGAFTGEVKMLDGEGRAVMTSEFPGRPAGSALLTAPSVAAIVFVLILAAYAVAVGVGRADLPGTGAMGLMGVGFGVAMVVLGWASGAPEPRARTWVLCAALGAAAGVLLAQPAGAGGATRIVSWWRSRSTSAKASSRRNRR